MKVVSTIKYGQGRIISPVHRHVMMDTMKEEMQHQEERSIRKQAIQVEQETVKSVFQDGPSKVAEEEGGSHFRNGFSRRIHDDSKGKAGFDEEGWQPCT
jgi:hypothetical protein